MRTFLFGLLVILTSSSYAQKNKMKRLKSNNLQCNVLVDRIYKEDSSSWNGDCKNGLANGTGTMILYTKGKATARYFGDMIDGKPAGSIEYMENFDNQKFWSKYQDRIDLNFNIPFLK